MRRVKKSESWSQLKQRLRGVGNADLLDVVRDLYSLNSENRRFLEARFLSSNGQIEHYRELISNAVYPDPFSRRPISITAAKRFIREYEQATHDPVGTLDLRLTFVEKGTDQAVDLGYEDGQYFAALESMLDLVLESMRRLPNEVHDRYLPRLTSLRDRGRKLGWGYGDFLRESIDQSIRDEEP
jgi:hypothetical protein